MILVVVGIIVIGIGVTAFVRPGANSFFPDRVESQTADKPLLATPETSPLITASVATASPTSTAERPATTEQARSTKIPDRRSPTAVPEPTIEPTVVVVPNATAMSTPEPPPLVRFAVAGDIGTGDSYAYSVADSVGRSAALLPFDGLIILGDNVYPNGDPSRLEPTLFEPYGPILEGGAELLPILGNHDVRDGNGDGQVEKLAIPGRWYASEIRHVLFIGLDSTQPESAEQLIWLEQTLSESDAKWKIAALHHPPYSAGQHGSDELMQESFVPIFEKYGVDLVLSGHDHDYQRSEPINGVTYIVSGAGSGTRPVSSEWFTEVSLSALHHLELNIYEDEIMILAIAVDDRVFDRSSIP